MEFARQRKDQENETNACLRQGRLYRKENQIETAISYYEKGLEIAKEQADQENEKKANLELGDAYRECNEIQIAFGYYDKASKIARRQQDKEQEIIVQDTIKEMSSMGGKLQKEYLLSVKIY